KDDDDVSSSELDAMAEAAWNSPGCIGARMTGAGFGGACVALVQNDQLSQFVADCSARYTEQTGNVGKFWACKAAAGAGIIE
ncbi:MAG: galactokinase, partial [Fimbriimonadaceae bacterium]